LRATALDTMIRVPYTVRQALNDTGAEMPLYYKHRIFSHDRMRF